MNNAICLHITQFFCDPGNTELFSFHVLFNIVITMCNTNMEGALLE